MKLFKNLINKVYRKLGKIKFSISYVIDNIKNQIIQYIRIRLLPVATENIHLRNPMSSYEKPDELSIS